MSRYLLLAVLLFAAARTEGQILGPPAHPEQIVIDATNVMVQTMSLQSGIPQKLLAEAQGIAIVPGMVRGAFVVGLQHGRGVLLMRGPGGAWQPPRAISITGGSLGYQIGVQSTDLILVFRTPQSVANVLRGTLKVGVDASAAAGPVGRQASAATDLPLQAEILSYSRARGAFVGVSVDGSSISLDPAADAAYYQPPGTVPASASQLIQIVTAYSSGAPPGTGPVVQPVAATVPTANPAAKSELELTRQQLDASSRKLAAGLDDAWNRYLALPPEIYIPYNTPGLPAIEEAIARYEGVSRQTQYASLAARPEFQETLKGLWRLRDLQRGVQQSPQLPPPPISANAR